MVEQGGEERARRTALWCTSAPVMERLWPHQTYCCALLIRKSVIQLQRETLVARSSSLAMSLIRLNIELKSTNSIRAFVSFLSRCCTEQRRGGGILSASTASAVGLVWLQCLELNHSKQLIITGLSASGR